LDCFPKNGKYSTGITFGNAFILFFAYKGKDLSYRETIGKYKQIIIIVVAAGAVASYMLPLDNLLAAKPTNGNSNNANTNAQARAAALSGSTSPNGHSNTGPGTSTGASTTSSAAPCTNLGHNNNGCGNIGNNNNGNGNTGNGNSGNGNVGNLDNGNGHLGSFCQHGKGNAYGCVLHNPHFTG
jgi:hypothetical protein